MASQKRTSIHILLAMMILEIVSFAAVNAQGPEPSPSPNPSASTVPTSDPAPPAGAPPPPLPSAPATSPATPPNQNAGAIVSPYTTWTSLAVTSVIVAAVA